MRQKRGFSFFLLVFLNMAVAKWKYKQTGKSDSLECLQLEEDEVRESYHFFPDQKKRLESTTEERGADLMGENPRRI